MYPAEQKYKWLEKYKENNQDIFESRPIKKSKYTNISLLEESLQKEKGEQKIQIKGNAKTLSIEQALKEMPEKIRKIINSEEKAKDQFESFINKEFEQGEVIILKEGKIEMHTKLPDKTPVKNIIILETGKADFIQVVEGKGTTMLNETIYIGEGAKLNYAKIHKHRGKSFQHQQNIIEKDSELNTNNSWLNGEKIRANTHNILNGEGSGVKEYSLLIGDGKEHWDINYNSVHRKPNCFSHCYYNSALKDESSNVFDGMIYIEKGADKTNALLECNAMILGKGAQSNQIPSLEIKTDDVKATHSATVARIEDDEIFYLSARGISKDEAERMIVKSFIEKIIYMLPEELRGQITLEVNRKI